MLVADTYVGNVEADPALADRVDRADALTVTVDVTDRRRSRFRTTTADGTELGVVVGRELRAGDVLSADGTLVTVSLEPIDAMVVDLGRVDATQSTLSAALALGHAVGNRHWDLAVDGDSAYFPVTEPRDRMEAEVEPNLPDGATVEYEKVSPKLFDESGMQHADAGSHEHEGGHTHAGGHDHAHGDGHSHSHGATEHSHGVRELDPEGSP